MRRLYRVTARYADRVVVRHFQTQRAAETRRKLVLAGTPVAPQFEGGHYEPAQSVTIERSFPIKFPEVTE